MKTKHLLLMCLMLMLSVTAIAQVTPAKKYSLKENIPFGKKLPPPDLTENMERSTQQMNQGTSNTSIIPYLKTRDIKAFKKNLKNYRQQLKDRNSRQSLLSQANALQPDPGNRRPRNSDFHLTKDINALAESYPNNYPDFFSNTPAYQPPGNTYYPTAPFAVLNDVAYFAADDGIHGNELWRTDGTAAGTYMIKDIEPGAATSELYAITASNGKLYFAAYTSADGYAAWVSDGTESGTQMLTQAYNVTTFFSMGKRTYFVSDGSDFWSALWETDGTAAGTKQVIDFSNEGIGLLISEPTVVNHTIFFTLLNYTTGYELWKTDGTDTGTHHLATNTSFVDVPLQLTKYNNKLYFSSDDGTGRKLWVSDGTDAGTMPAPGNNDIMVDVSFSTSFVLFYTIQPLPILDHILYFAGTSASKGNGLYKYDASNNDGVVLVKDLVPNGDTASIVSHEMQVANHKLYFKVTNNTGGVHDELWSSQGTKTSTRLVYKLLPEETINNLYNGDGNLYFVKYGKIFGTELWKIFHTPFGSFPFIESDIFKGPTSSFPKNLTAFKKHLIFSAANGEKGDELFATNSVGFGATLVKDINITSTSSSNAGLNFYNSLYSNYYNGMAALGKNVLFNAYERVHGYELYKSDGTSAGTKLLNDVIRGEKGFNIYRIVSKNNAAYFIARNGNSYSIYKTNGTKNSLHKITPDYNSIQSSTVNSIQSLSVTNNGLVFYVVSRYNPSLGSSTYELWRTNGTAAGTLLLSATLSNQYYLQVIGNRALFVAGDNDHGYELWQSDGTVFGTQMVKDINPGNGGSDPGGLFIYKNAVFFAAYDGVNHAFWKSDGTESGTVEVKNIDPWWDTDVTRSARFFCVSKNILYFSALDYSNSDGTVLWKTDGTPEGTQPIKDINPSDSSVAPGPYYLTDVNGTVFFAANDGVNGVGLWKTDGTADGTQLVKNVASYPYISSTPAGPMNGLTSFGGKLYFQNQANFKYYLWVSDGTADGTHAVEDPGIVNAEIKAIFSTGDKLFLSANTQEYGTELYITKVDDQPGKFVMARPADEETVITSLPFNAELYPNPVISNATLQLTGNTKNVSIAITDMSGRKLWQSNRNNARTVTLPTEKFVAGNYFVTVTSDLGSKTIKIIKH